MRAIACLPQIFTPDGGYRTALQLDYTLKALEIRTVAPRTFATCVRVIADSATSRLVGIGDRDYEKLVSYRAILNHCWPRVGCLAFPPSSRFLPERGELIFIPSFFPAPPF